MKTKVNQLNISNMYFENTKMDNGIFDFVYATYNNFILMTKVHFRGSSFYLGNILIPILITIGVMTFIPIHHSIIWMLFMGLTFSGLSTYGTVFFAVRKSTLINNVSLTRDKMSSLYFSTFLLMGVVLVITFFVLMSSGLFLDVINYASQTIRFGNIINPPKELLWHLDWGKLILDAGIWYYLVEQIFICFALSFFIEKIVTTQKNFFIFLMIYITGGIFFSGIFSSSLYLNESNQLMIMDHNEMQNIPDVFFLRPYCWGGYSWWLGQLFPHFGANQLAINISRQCSYRVDAIGVVEWSRWSDTSILLSSLNNIRTTYYLFLPWVWTLLLISAATMIESKLKK